MIKKYNEFVNEEINFKKIAAAGALAATLATTSCTDKICASKVDTEEVDKATFTQYKVVIPGPFIPNITFNVSDNNIIGSKWNSQNGKSQITHYTVTVPEGVTQIHYQTAIWDNELYADDDMDNNNIVNLNDLEVVEETTEYIVLDGGNWFKTVDYIMINKNYTNKENEFVIDGKTYTYLNINGTMFGDNYFIVPVK